MVFIIALLAILALHLMYSYTGVRNKAFNAVIIVLVAILLMSIIKVSQDMPDMNRYIQRINNRNIRKENI